MIGDMNELLLKSVEVLPPLPDAVSKLRKYVSEANSNIETMKVAEIISSDPLMTANFAISKFSLLWFYKRNYNHKSSDYFIRCW